MFLQKGDILKSMTGYSRITESTEDVTYSLELKGVNHKYFTASFALPSLFSSFEVRSLPIIREYVKRGSILVKADIRGDFESGLVKPDIALAKAYYEAMVSVKEELGIESDGINVSDIIGVRELFKMELNPQSEEHIWDGFKNVLRKALKSYNVSREIEGEKLKKYLTDYLNDFEELVRTMYSYEEANRERYREMIVEKIGKFSNVEIDRERLEQEVILMIQRSDIGEELSRLESHISRARELMNSSDPTGGELDFIFQEFSREMNTLSNKSKIHEVLNSVVKGKTLIKKLREQVQNIE